MTICRLFPLLQIISAVVATTCNTNAGFPPNRQNKKHEQRLFFETKTRSHLEALFRHGNRSIGSPSYPNDPYKDPKYWPIGFGQLSDSGWAQAKELGTWLRNRYDHLLSAEYDPDEIFIRSTNVNRTILSAKACLSGLFQESQDIPIAVEAGPNYNLLQIHDCPAFANLRGDLFQNNEWYKSIINNNEDLMKKASKGSGWNITNLYYVYGIFNQLMVESDWGFKLPDWTEDLFPEPLKSLSIQAVRLDCYTPDMTRLAIGPFLQELYGNFHNIALNNSTRKAVLYSGHDLTIGDLLNGLKVFNNALTPYSAAVVMELHLIDDQFFVKFLYRNTTIIDPHVLTLPGCDALCPLHDFHDILQPILPRSDEKC